MRIAQQVLGGCVVLLAVVVINSGCTRYKPKEEAKDDHHHHAHPEKGPNGGPLAELGEEEFHAEFVPDPDKKQATIYILDGAAKDYVPIEEKEVVLTLTKEKPPVQVTASAQPQEKEKGSSRFLAEHGKFGEKIDAADIAISVKIKGKPYEGHFSHEHK